jgi:Glyoxalase/Bleomycin resistance protein/Dioxygenase superfamily
VISDFENIPELPAIMGPAKQIAYMVDDIDAAIKRWHQEYGVGPFLVTRNAVPLTNAYYRGEKAGTTRLNIAFAYVGDMQLELIELIDDTPGLYREALDRKHYGVHHYAVLVDDFPVAYNWALDHGFDAVIDAGVDGLARMSYVENPHSGLILEVIEWNPLTKPYFEGLEQMVRSADKGQLVHEFTLGDITPKTAVFSGLAKYLVKKVCGRVKPTRRPRPAPATA